MTRQTSQTSRLCKLWNDKADIPDIKVGQVVEITNVHIQEYAGKKSVSSSDETTTKVFYFYCI